MELLSDLGWYPLVVLESAQESGSPGQRASLQGAYVLVSHRRAVDDALERLSVSTPD
jgi:hypothetical protein